MNMATMVLEKEIDPEQSVIEAIQSGDEQAFAGFMGRQSRWVRGVIYGVLGSRDRLEDVEQQVWLSVWKQSGELRDISLWRSWLYRLVRNAAIDAGRDESRRKRNTREYVNNGALLLPQVVSDSDDVRGETHSNERSAKVLEAIQALPTHYREPFVLRHLMDWGYREIGSLLDLPVDTVETRLVRARRLLRETLKDRVL